MRPSTVERCTLIICWALTIALWTLAGEIAIDLIGDRVPAAYNLLLSAAIAATGASVYLTVTHNSRRNYTEQLNRIEDALRGRDEAWAAVNRALSTPTGERPNLRLASYSTDAN